MANLSVQLGSEKREVDGKGLALSALRVNGNCKDNQRKMII